MNIDVAPIKVKADLTHSADRATETVVEPIQGICKGVGKILSAFLDPWFAHQEGKRRLIAAQYKKYEQDILDGKLQLGGANTKNIPISDNTSFDELCKQRVLAETAFKSKRLNAAMGDAMKEAREIPDEKISDDPVDQTFFNHWRREAELIDDEEVRQWWVHLLVEETKKPKSISPRTLDVAKNLSKDEAQLFARMAKSIVVQTLLVDHKSEPLGGTYGELLSLQDAGLVSSMISNRDFFAGDEESHNCVLLPFFDCNLVVAFKYNKISIRCYILTKAGKEINSISQNTLSLDEIKAIAEEISKQNNNAIGFIYQMYNVSDDPNNARYIHYDVDWDHPLWTNHLETN